MELDALLKEAATALDTARLLYATPIDYLNDQCTGLGDRVALQHEQGVLDANSFMAGHITGTIVTRHIDQDLMKQPNDQEDTNDG
jgi:hypothetical protein